jgi:zinc transport system permease protein
MTVPGWLGPLLSGSQGDMTFWAALPIIGNGLLACIVCGLLCGFLGVHVVLRRIVFASAAIAQVSSLGLALALCLPGTAAGMSGAPTMASLPGLAAVAAAIAAAIGFGNAGRERRLTREAVLGVAYALPSAIVLLVLDHLAGESHLIENVLFGNTVFVPDAQLVILGVTVALIAVLHFLYGRPFLSITFDPDFAAGTGVPVRWLDQLFYVSLAVALAVMIGTIGVMPVFGLLVMPAVAGLLLASRAGAVLAISAGLGTLAAALGFYLSYVYSAATGPAILATSGGLLAVSALWSAYAGRR